jgi:shikimate kinase
MRIYLVGFMATGKTTVGRALAHRLNYEFQDLDEMLEEREGRSVREIFRLAGETEFRRLERRALRDSASRGRLVIATGGGSFCRDDNRRWIERHGVSVWLDLPFSEIARRLEISGVASRPLFADPSVAKDLFAARRPAYAKADVRQPLHGNESTQQIIESIENKLREQQCAL